jgi:DNA invertase Pin-like site-specific DNA recombinase
VLADIYTRKSSLDKALSLATQEDETRADILAEGWRVGTLFSDPELSASRFAKKPRPDFEQLLQHINAGKCEALALWEASRGSRNLSEWINLLELCRDKTIPIRVTSHRRTYEVWRRRDWRTMAEEGLDAHDESEKTSERVLRGMRGSALAGRPAGSPVFGYLRRYDERRRYVGQVEHPEQAPIVRQIFDDISRRVPLRVIADDLNDRGIPSTKGMLWTRQTIRRMALSRTYLGERVHRGVVAATGCWPPLVTQDVFADCERILSAPERRTSKDPMLKHVLTNVPICGKCGTGTLAAKYIRTNPGQPPHRLYGCTSCRGVWVNADYMDDFIQDLVREHLRQPGSSALFTPPSADEKAIAAKREVARLQDLMDEHYASAAAGQLSAAGLVAMERLLLPQIEATARRAKAGPSLAFLRGMTPARVADVWDDLPVAHRRHLIVAACELRIGKGSKGKHGLDRSRLTESRWRGDTRTWGEIWAAAQVDP